MLLFSLLLAAPIETAFIPMKSDEAIQTNCTKNKKLCLQIQAIENAPILSIKNGAKFDVIKGFSFAKNENDAKYSLHNKIYELGNSQYLIGIIDHSSTMYSGGGASAENLHLYKLSKNGKIWGIGQELLNIPYSGSKLIRSCFSEQDYEDRLGACHDEYNYSADLKIVKGSNTKIPALIYKVRSTTFPSNSSLEKDNSGKLKKSDLVAKIDETCTFTRNIIFDSKKGIYKLNKPLPNCDDFLVF